MSHDNSVPDSSLRPPLQPRWEIELGELRANALIADGRIFVTTNDGTSTHISALSAATGQVLWTRPSDAYLAGMSYDNGRVFVASLGWSDPQDGVADRGHMVALDATSGSLLWERTFTSEYGIAAAPTAVDGVVYLLTQAGTDELDALRESDGSTIWASDPLNSGSFAVPAVDAANLYLSLNEVYAIRRDTGAVRWKYTSCADCGSIGTGTPMLHGNLLFNSWAFDPTIHDVSTGAVVGHFPGGSQDAFAGDLLIANSFPGMSAFAPDGSERWRYMPYVDGDTVSNPMTAGGTVYMKEGQPYLTGVDVASGLPVWCGAFQLAPGSPSSSEIGAAATGEGILLVSIGYGLIAMESGSGASGCPSGAGGPGSQPAGSTAPPASGAPAGGVFGQQPATGGGPALTLQASPAVVTLGKRVRVTGALLAGRGVGGQAVRIEASPFPFRAYKTLATVRTAPDGSFTTRFKPSRNTRLRAILEADHSVVSPVATAYAELRSVMTRIGAGGAHPRVRWKVFAPAGAPIRRQRVSFYLAKAGSWTRVDKQRWRSSRSQPLVAVGHYPAGRLKRGDHVLVCTPEPRPDGYGRRSRIDRQCGQATVPGGRIAAAADYRPRVG